MNISVNGDRPGAVYSGADTAAVASSGSESTRAGGGPGGEDRLSVSAGTLRIQATLSTLSASQVSRVSRLQSLYASGRYDASSTRTAQSMVSGALTNPAL